jgi:hypothetical protein
MDFVYSAKTFKAAVSSIKHYFMKSGNSFNLFQEKINLFLINHII